MASSSVLFIKGNGKADLHTQLWYECAGLAAKIPHVGDKVFYFPQGHLEQVEAYMLQENVNDIPNYGLPPKVLCKVVSVKLKAEADTEEVYAQITLIQDFEEPKGLTFRNVREKVPSVFFRKKLTPSDVSKQGGCSLHKKDVDRTFPPLDMSSDSASQDLVFKDLNGRKWQFHHICRGAPRRHLLTSGWGKFVSSKKLLAGDTCIFFRGQSELYIGVQRAVRLVKLSTDLSSVNMQHGILVTAKEALRAKTEFTVYYHPRISPSGFLVGYNEFIESVKVNYLPKTKVKMHFEEGREEADEHNLKKLSGIIKGKEDIDPARWPRSEWRCLKVCWDATSDGHIPPERVSPWDIQSVSLVSLGQKRLMPMRPPMIGSQDESKKYTGLTFPKVNIFGSTCQDECNKSKIFGVDIRHNNPSYPSQQQCRNNPSLTTSSYIKVLRHGNLLGRSIDVSRFSGYGGLISELDKMFEFEGRLACGTSGWLITYIDKDGNKKLLGDFSWLEFRAVVQKITIYPKEEVARWNRSG